VKPPPEIERAFYSLRRGEGHGKVLEWLAAEKERLVSSLIRSQKKERWRQGYLACLDDLLRQLSQ
jgi:hypothetical protein